jgi:hypothetical protein
MYQGDARQGRDAKVQQVPVARPLLVAGILLSSGLALAGQANHIQTDGKSIVFDHVGGNEWWVEARLAGQDGGQVTGLWVAAYPASEWTQMTWRADWGKWAASLHVPPGHPVEFRATWDGGAMQTSCWFSHPDGAESCSAQSAWTARDIARIGGHGGDDIAVGDGDNDGRDEVYFPTNDAVSTLKWTSTGWVRSPIFQDAGASFGAIAVGDANNDGRREVWTSDIRDAIMLEWSGTAWVERVRVATPHGVGSITVGDVDDDGRRDLYVAGFGSISIVTINGYSPTVRILAALPEASTSGIWIGDGNGDGDRELAVVTEYKGVGGIYLVDHDAGGATVERVAGISGGRAIATGDGDRDGKGEVFTAGTTFTPEGSPREGIHLSKHTASGWTTTHIASAVNVDDIAFGDADNDGRAELYATAGDITLPGRVVQVHWTGSAWATVHVSGLGAGPSLALSVGDADADSLREIYAMGADSWSECCDNVDVYWVANHPAPAPPVSGFDATFTGVRGNEWWEQAFVSATGGTLSKVDVRLNGGAWQPLPKQSWGGWAASYRAIQGTIVQFQATSTTGATDLSDCYQWIPASNADATKISCGTPPPGFDATFSGVKGNEWWVQANVAGNQPIAKVEARVDCGPTWQTLTLQSWGGYAKSFHVPNGAKVDLRATSTTGPTDLSGGYIWPQATPTGACA